MPFHFFVYFANGGERPSVTVGQDEYFIARFRLQYATRPMKHSVGVLRSFRGVVLNIMIVHEPAAKKTLESLVRQASVKMSADNNGATVPLFPCSHLSHPAESFGPVLRPPYSSK